MTIDTMKIKLFGKSTRCIACLANPAKFYKC